MAAGALLAALMTEAHRVPEFPWAPVSSSISWKPKTEEFGFGQCLCAGSASICHVSMHSQGDVVCHPCTYLYLKVCDTKEVCVYS